MYVGRLLIAVEHRLFLFASFLGSQRWQHVIQLYITHLIQEKWSGDIPVPPPDWMKSNVSGMLNCRENGVLSNPPKVKTSWLSRRQNIFVTLWSCSVYFTERKQPKCEGYWCMDCSLVYNWVYVNLNDIIESPSTRQDRIISTVCRTHLNWYYTVDVLSLRIIISADPGIF